MISEREYDVFCEGKFMALISSHFLHLESLIFGKLDNSILCVEAHNEGYYVTSGNARRRSKPRRDQSCEHVKRVEKHPNCVHWRIFYFM